MISKSIAPLIKSFLPTIVIAGLLCTCTTITMADSPNTCTVQGKIPADWPSELPGLVAVPLPPDTNFKGTLQAQVNIENATQPLTLPAQAEPANKICGLPAQAWFILPAQKGKPAQSITVKLSNASTGTYPSIYQSRMEGPQLHITQPNKQPVISYWHGQPEPDRSYPLTSFIHPVVGLDGEIISNTWSKDHPHHRALFWAWVRNEVNGHAAGCWWAPQQKKIYLKSGEIRHCDGPVFSRFLAEHTWIHKGEQKEIPFVKETVVCRVFKTSPHGRAIDVILGLQALQDGVRIGGQTALNKGYGGLTFRYAKAKDVVLQSEGDVMEVPDQNHHRSRWVTWTGKFTGKNGKFRQKRSGAAILVPRNHPDYPPEWVTRAYGVLNVSYPGLSMLEIPKDSPLQLPYRIWVHRGDAGTGKIDTQYRVFCSDWQWTQH